MDEEQAVFVKLTVSDFKIWGCTVYIATYKTYKGPSIITT